MSDPRIVVALDVDSAGAALALAETLDPARCRVKVGKQLFTRGGAGLVTALVHTGFDVFLDLKYHDIPNTVAQACRAAADLGVWMLNVHVPGGRRMLEAARAAVDAGGRRPLLVGVTVLTSLTDTDLAEVGIRGGVTDQVQRLARLAWDTGLDGVVCSPREIALLRGALDPGFVLVTPGIRPAGADAADQRRVMTPAEAVRQGASYLVIGRPVTAAPDPMAALAAIEAEIAAA